MSRTDDPDGDEAPIDPLLPVLDAHYHLWDRPTDSYLMPQFAQDAAAGHNVRAAIHAECRSMYRAFGPPESQPLGETEFAVGQAAMCESGRYGGRPDLCAAIIGAADLMLGARVRAVLEAHVAAANGRFRGIRFVTAWEGTGTLSSPYETWAGMMSEPRLREGFACLAPLGLTFDAWVYHPQLDELTALAAAFPDTTIVLNHLGGPLGIGPYAGRRAEIFSSWSAAVGRLAQLPNVHVKLGGLGMPMMGFGFDRSDKPVTSRELADAWRPYIETCVEAFGAERCMFETNYPVDRVTARYGTLWNAFKRVAAGASAADRAALFHDTAARVYRIAPSLTIDKGDCDGRSQ